MTASFPHPVAVAVAATATLAGSLLGSTGASATGVAPVTDRTPRCHGEPATLVGTSASNELHGTTGRDVVVSGGGDDFVFTGRGGDLVCLGSGFDYARLGAGADRVFGGAGDDTLHGGPGSDRMSGQEEIDSLSGGAGDDRLRGGSGRSFVVEGLLGGPGDDLLVGGRGRDSAQYFDSRQGVRVDLRHGRASGNGADTLVGIEGVVGSNSADVIIGDSAGNGLFGQGGDDSIRAGGSGRLLDGSADVISGDLGDDELFGGRGEDLVTYARVPLPVTVDLESGVATGQGRDLLSGVDAVQGSLLDDTLTGGPAADLIAGSVGHDVIDGAGGADTVVYRDVRGPVDVRIGSGASHGEAAGNDTIARVESIWGTNADDDLQGDDGRNVILGFAGDDRLVGYGEVDLLDGGAGTDTCEDAPEQLVNCEEYPSAAPDLTRDALRWPLWLLPARR